jgi:hypothetical protein
MNILMHDAVSACRPASVPAAAEKASVLVADAPPIEIV